MSFCNLFKFALVLFLDLYFYLETVNSSNILSRNVRSPGIFGNRELPKIGESLLGGQLRPVTLNDILSLRDQITNLTRLSEFFRKAIEQEKKARNMLQGQFETAKQKVQQLQSSVNPDAANFWAVSNSCGGIVIGQTGKIDYKKDEYCSTNERCVWTLRVNQRSKVKLKVIKGDFKGNYGFLTASEISLNADYQRSVTRRISTVNEVFLLDGPLIILTFFTETIGSGFGFSLEFEGIGNNINPPVLFKHFHLTDKNGSILYPDVQNTSEKLTQNSPKQDLKEMTTYVINPKNSNASWLNVTAENILLNKENCGNTSLNLYPDLISEYSYPEGCCTKNCATDFQSLEGIFFIDVVKDASDEDISFNISWILDTNIQPDISRDECGGLLNITSVGRIEYKYDTYYKNNERCVWRVHSAYKKQIKMQLIKEGFENGYDYLTLTEINFQTMDPPNSIRFPLERSVIILTGPDVFITFYSDNTQIGTGFILTMEAVGPKRNPVELQDTHFHLTDESKFSFKKSLPSSEDGDVEMGPLSSTIVINPTYPDGNSVTSIIRLDEIQTESVDADDVKIAIYVSNGALFVLHEWYNGSHILENSALKEGVNVESDDGIIIVRYENTHVKTDLELQWDKGMKNSDVTIGEGDLYIEQSDQCGGILVGDVGKITYKLNETYEVNERCTWTIRSLKRSKITIKLVKDDFEFCCDYLIVKELDVETGTLKNTTAQIRRDENTMSFGPVIFLTFVSDKSEAGKGFVVTFATGGQELSNEILFHHKLLKDQKGEYSYPERVEEPQATQGTSANEISTYVISPILNSENDKIHLTLDQLNVNGENSCHLSIFAIYSYDFYTTEEYLVKGSTAEDCGSFKKVALEQQRKSIDGWFIVIFKSASPAETSFKFQWEKS